MLWLALALTGTVTFLLNRPILLKPLVVDEGNWFYLAIFHELGVRQFYEKRIPNPQLRSKFVGYHTHGYCNIQHYARFFSWLCKNKSVRFFQSFKLGILCCAAMSVCALGGVLTGNVFVALGAGLLMAMVMAVPQTLFHMTYAEFAQISSVNMAVLCAVLGLEYHAPVLLLLAGLGAAQTVQFKPTGWLFTVASGGLLILLALFGKVAWWTVLWATAGFSALMLWPVLWLWSRCPGWLWLWQPARYYMHYTLYYPIRLGISVVRIFTLHLLKRFHSQANQQPPATSDYTLKLVHGARGKKIELLKRYLGPALQILWPVPLLALGQLVWGLPSQDMAVWIVLGIFLICLGAEVLQQAYFTPHFGPFWSPVCILAAMTVTQSVLAWNSAQSCVIVVLILFLLWQAGRHIKDNFKPSAANDFSVVSRMDKISFVNASAIGEGIRERSRPDDKLLVIGDAPHVYIYAQRECLHSGLIFLYHPNPRLYPELMFISMVRAMPPEWLQWFDWRMVGDWNIQRVQDTTGIRYNLDHAFPIRDAETGQLMAVGDAVLAYPLYRRDDVSYTHRLLARAVACADSFAKRCWLEAAQKVAKNVEQSPLVFECHMRLSLLDTVSPLVDAAKFARKATTSQELATVSLLLAELSMAEKNWESAQSHLHELELAKDPRPDTLRAEVAYGLGKRAQTIRYANKALQIDPWYAEAYNALGVVMLEAGKEKEAEEFIEKATLYHPEHPSIAANLAALWGEEGARRFIFYLCINHEDATYPNGLQLTLQEARAFAKKWKSGL